MSNSIVRSSVVLGNHVLQLCMRTSTSYLMASSNQQHCYQLNKMSRAMYSANSMEVYGAYQAERAGADFNPGLPVGGCHPHAILQDGDHGPLLLLLHIPLLWA